MQLPLIPCGTTPINNVWSVENRGDTWTYFVGISPVFQHPANSHQSFRMFTAQMVCQGACRQSEIMRAFGVSKNSVSRSVEKYRKEGAEAFYRKRKGSGGRVITDEVKIRIEALFSEGEEIGDVAEQLEIKKDTLRKAISQGRIREPILGINQEEATDKSTRSHEDAEAGMGNACTRPLERLVSSVGLFKGGAPVRFECCHDIRFGGVISALPALLSNGLLSHVEKCFKSLTGYYTTMQILILLAYMALSRIKTVEQLQYQSPGELGKLMGLDRVPEVRCLRKKLAVLSENEAPQQWSRLLSRDWMENSPELAGVLYVDGHVRVYHGAKTELPKRFVSRERLCLRGTTDYWVNDALGQPFFVVNRPVDRGLIEALRGDIIPQLLAQVPEQPLEDILKDDPHRERFTIIFDREGYSPALFKELWANHRIACITYHKHPQIPWSESCFAETQVKMPSGEILTLKLAEMGSWIGSWKDGLWMREVRKLCKDGHQTSLVSSAKSSFMVQDAARIFARWSQENFFAYMEKHFAFDLLNEYGTQELSGKIQVVNPAWRELEYKRKSLSSKLTNRRAKFANLECHPELGNPKKIADWEKKKTEILEQIENFEHEIKEIKVRLKETPKHIDWDKMAPDIQFEQLKPNRKRLMDTIKMIAYRAETAMVNILREKLARNDDARSLVQDLCRSEADIIPDETNNTLMVQIHSMANARSNNAIQHLLHHLNDAAYNYPGTKLRLVYRMV